MWYCENSKVSELNPLPFVKIYVAAADLTFILIDDNARLHTANLMDEYIESEGITRME